MVSACLVGSASCCGAFEAGLAVDGVVARGLLPELGSGTAANDERGTGTCAVGGTGEPGVGLATGPVGLGCGLGRLVGDGLTCLVGEGEPPELAEGVALGVADGELLGVADGVVVGVAVGSGDGLVVGVSVGAGAVLSVGVAVGSADVVTDRSDGDALGPGVTSAGKMKATVDAVTDWPD